MFQGLSLEQAPPYKIPLKFFITASFYLLIFSIVLLINIFEISSRFEYETIAIVHSLTLGFFSHVMFGAMFQMIPVMLGLPYDDVEKKSNIIYFSLNIGILFFLFGFLTTKLYLLHVSALFLGISFIYFSYISLKTVLKSEEKDYLVLNFATSFLLLLIGSVFGLITLIGHLGFVDSVKFGDIHISFMLFGWIFLLLNAVSYRIIPMFFVAKEFPLFIKNNLYKIIGGLLFLFFIFRINDDFESLKYIKALLSLSVIVFALKSIEILKNRKRARKDITVNLWYFSMINLIVASILFIINQFLYNDISLIIGFFALFGVYSLINGMLYKIVPFLTWFHLSSSMVFDAEMNDVIKKEKMRLQISFYHFSYICAMLGIFSKWFFVAGIISFFISSLILIKNLIDASKYYDEYIKKKIDMGNFAS